MQPRNEKIATLQREVDALKATLASVDLKTANGTHLYQKTREQLASKYNQFAEVYEQSLSTAELANQEDIYRNTAFYIARAYYSGGHIDKDEKKAFEWFQIAAKQELVEAQFNIGVMYYQGSAVAKDYKMASEWFNKAALQGYQQAQYNLAAMYWNGEYFEKNNKKALEWFQRAALQGEAQAQYILGKLYAIGDNEDIEQNDIMAIMWLRKSLKTVDDAKKLMGKLIDRNRALVKNDYEKLLTFINKDAAQVKDTIHPWKSANQFDAVKYEILAYLFGIEDKNIRFNQLLKALCKSTAMGAILYEPVGFTLKSANIAKGRLGEVARALNDLADDNDNTFTIDNDVKTLLQTQISSDKSFVPNLETTYKALHKQLMNAGVITRPAIMQHREVEMTTLNHNRK